MPTKILPTGHIKTSKAPTVERLDELARNKKFGPAPINIFESLRGKLSIRQVSLYSGVDAKVIARTEAGMYSSPPPAMMDYFTKKASYVELMTEYEKFRKEQRLRHPRFLGNIIIDYTKGSPHPFRQLRERWTSLNGTVAPVGVTQVCKALCIPIDSVFYFERKWRRQQTIPKALLNALRETGYSSLEVEYFEADYKTWRVNNK